MTDRIGIMFRQYGHGNDRGYEFSVAIWVGEIRIIWPRWLQSGLWLYAVDARCYFQPYQRVEMALGWRIRRIYRDIQRRPEALAGDDE